MTTSRGESQDLPQNTRSAVHDSVRPGVHTDDQMTREYKTPPRKTPQDGNRVPDVECRNEGPL